VNVENCIFIGPEHCGVAAEIIGRAIIHIQDSGSALPEELEIWLLQMKRINKYADSLRKDNAGKSRG